MFFLFFFIFHIYGTLQIYCFIQIRTLFSQDSLFHWCSLILKCFLIPCFLPFSEKVSCYFSLVLHQTNMNEVFGESIISVKDAHSLLLQTVKFGTRSAVSKCHLVMSLCGCGLLLLQTSDIRTWVVIVIEWLCDSEKFNMTQLMGNLIQWKMRPFKTFSLGFYYNLLYTPYGWGMLTVGL